MDETEDLIRLSGRALVAQMCEAPGFELQMTRNCVLGLTSEPLADFNMLILGADPDAVAFLDRSVARANERRLPLLVTMSPNVAKALAPAAARLGLTAVGTAPLMVLRAGTVVRQGRPCRITRALGPELVRVAGDLVSAGFEAPRDVVARCMDVGITETAGVETYIAWDDDEPMSVVSVTPTGNTVGVSAMATPPEHQRKGMGRALLTHVIEDYRSRGAQRFHLTATEAGLPLYSSVGFETIAELSVWVLEHTHPASS
ncbi:MAG TPA: GNAT family N-acetyltransferase [Phenylobacterium sp.]|jgi:GNAT superfamily N-acetyltransferase|uniref:GNAT family N-acetyltransferase n=1 Tax=Phenylobacterium sp. TaxID=1871053 RepID=UPI002D286620|nr:GNAT family N-acetyltransferase [Phenylobacterium sp.]HZZ69804.1 GNAT family N-acetyltransferase [Phenylobacterium sp.]